jgi:hypothetical protein
VRHQVMEDNDGSGDRGLLGLREQYEPLSWLQLSGMVHIARTSSNERKSETVQTTVRNVKVRPSLGCSSVTLKAFVFLAT